MISPATVSDSLRVLAAKGLITKTRHRGDARSVLVMITDAGREAATGAAQTLETVRQVVADWDERRLSELLPAVSELIDHLGKDNAACVDGLCLACKHFAINCDREGSSAPHFCRAFNLPLREVDLRVDCSEFKSRT